MGIGIVHLAQERWLTWQASAVLLCHVTLLGHQHALCSFQGSSFQGSSFQDSVVQAPPRSAQKSFIRMTSFVWPCAFYAASAAACAPSTQPCPHSMLVVCQSPCVGMLQHPTLLRRRTVLPALPDPAQPVDSCMGKLQLPNEHLLLPALPDTAQPVASCLGKV